MKAREGALVARRYARAALDVATSSGQADALRAELDAAAALVAQNAELAQVLRHPAVPVDRKRALVQAIWKARHASPLQMRLLDLLAERGRLDLLPAVAEAYAVLHNAQKGVVRAEVTTAGPVDTTQQQALEAALSRAAGAQAVEVHSHTDPAVLGGVLVRMGGRTYDGTVRGRLGALRQRLAGRTAGSGA